MPKPILWTDLTVEHAEEINEFYSDIFGWKTEPVSMGDYSDFNIFEKEGTEPVLGICHARGDNADIPPVWLNYFSVVDVKKAIEKIEMSGGTIIKRPPTGGKFAIAKDPAGAVFALYQAEDA